MNNYFSIFMLNLFPIPIEAVLLSVPIALNNRWKKWCRYIFDSYH